MAADSTAPATVDSPEVLSVFEAALSDEEEGAAPAETPAAEQEDPQAAQADDEPSSEQGESPQAESPEQEEAPAEDPAEEPDSTTALDPSLKVKLKVDGEEVEVTLEELQKGYSRTADYTRKTQELAGHRKALESETQAVRQERLQNAERLRMLDEAVAEITPKEPNWEQVRRDHPDQFADLYIQWQQGEKDRAELRAQREAAEAVVRRDFEEARKARIESEAEKLKAAIPEWSKDDVRKAEKGELVKYAQSQGYTADDLNGIEDHRALVLLRKAMMFDKAQAAKPALIQRVKDKVATTKPGSAPVSRTPQTNLQKALSRLAKDRTQDAAASVFEAALDD